MKRVLQIALACLLSGIVSNAEAQTILEQRQNTTSNVQMMLTNDGIYGMNVRANAGGTYWPRGSKNQYIFGGGIWFGALKNVDGNDKKLTFLSYNPNSGISWAAPGRIEDGAELDSTQAAKYAMQFSTDYNPDGTAKNPANPKWPIWKARSGVLGFNGNYGSYVYAEADRSSVVYPKGAAFVSNEDIISVFKDTDMYRYELSGHETTNLGLPLGIQYEQAVYSWNIGTPLQDVIVMRYTMINTSQDVLKDCYFAPALDADLAIQGNVSEGAQNDHVKYFSERPDLQTAIQWTDENKGEKDFGVLAVSLIETPAVTANGNLRKDKKAYNFNEQIGLETFRNWTIDVDPLSSDLRYDFMSSGLRDGDNGPGDKRFLAATGPFTMQPGDTAHVAVSFTFANRVIKQAALKVDEITAQDDYTELISKIEAVRTELYPDLVASVETENLLKEKSAFISLKNDAATLHFKNDTFKNIRAELFNTLGERMMTIHNGDISTSEISFKTNELSAGMYYCVIASNGERITLPMTIVR
ncbi:MAG: hypothetical protein V4642_10345 [Bacteroidota bacterium]